MTDRPGGTAPVIDRFAADGIVPLLGSDNLSTLARAAEAVVASGLSTLEITLRSPNALDAFANLVKWAEREDLPLELGVGTVLKPAMSSAAISAGARFVFSPIVSAEVSATCGATNIPYFPGCATPTEIHRALGLGCSAVKLFPASMLGGPPFLRSVRAVFPSLSAIPTGGVSPDASELSDWFASGACAVGLGSALFGDAAATDDWADVEDRLRTAVLAVTAAREELAT